MVLVAFGFDIFVYLFIVYFLFCGFFSFFLLMGFGAWMSFDFLM
jgi:hypothetical protein